MLAATRHDDGWGVYDRRPTFDGTNDRPTSFLDVPIPAHLAFYRACIEVVTQEDAYAGLLVSMHGAGIYNGRYGTQPGLRLSGADEYQEQVDAFVAEQEATHAGRAAEAGAADTTGGRTTSSCRCTTASRCPFAFGTGRPRPPSGTRSRPRRSTTTAARPSSRSSRAGRWHVSIDPYPFTESPARFTVVRKVLPKRSHRDNAEFRREYFGTPSETVEITVEQA